MALSHLKNNFLNPFKNFSHDGASHNGVHVMYVSCTCYAWTIHALYFYNAQDFQKKEDL